MAIYRNLDDLSINDNRGSVFEQIQTPNQLKQ
jgi:hypothetical protein